MPENTEKKTLLPFSNLNEEDHPYEFVCTGEMPTQEWGELPPNPHNRRVDKREPAKYRKLLRLEECHRDVIIAEAAYLSGKIFKISGHTRWYVWSGEIKGRFDVPQKIEIPSTIRFTKYRVFSDTQLKALYLKQDSKLAVITAKDMIFGAEEALGVQFESPFLQKGQYGSGLKKLHTKTFGIQDSGDILNVDHMLETWKDELIALDSCLPQSSETFTRAMVTAALSTIAAYGESAVEFWKRYASGEGRQDDSGRDGVRVLLDTVTEMRAQRRNSQLDVDEMVSKAVACVQLWLEGTIVSSARRVHRGLNSSTMRRFWQELKAVKSNNEEDNK